MTRDRKLKRIDQDQFVFRFSVDIDGTDVEVMRIDALGRFYVRSNRIDSVKEEEGRAVFHALRDYATLLEPEDET